MSEPSKETRLWMYEKMATSRYLDDKLCEVYLVDKTPIFDFGAGPLPGELHTSQGQEPVGAGFCAVLTDTDMITAGHRPHHIAVAREVDLRKMVCELLGKKNGLCGGRGGHMHLYDKNRNFGCSGIVGEGMSGAAGMALSSKLRKQNRVAVSFQGDGAANQGVFHETLNLAAIYKLPYVCVIEDNGWGVTVSKKASTAIERNSDRAASYGIPGEYVEGNDPDLIYAAAQRAIERARRGEGPSIVEVQTIRMMGHFMGDPAPYIPEEEKNAWVDPVPAYREKLAAEGVAGEEQLAEIDARVRALVEETVQFALDSEYPAPEAALECVFAD